MKQLLIIIAIHLLGGCFSNDPYENVLKLKPLPSFNIMLTDSTTWINTASIPANKPIVMFFFSPHCPYCRAQMDDIMGNMTQLANIQFYLVSTFSIPELKGFYSEYKIAKYSNIIVGKDTANFSAKYFNTPGVPFTAVYGKGKHPSKFFLGKTAVDQIQKAVESLDN